MAEVPADQQHIHDDIAILGEELHRVVGLLAAFPPEVAAVVASVALQPVLRGKRRARLVGFISNEVKALRVTREAEAAAEAPRAAA